MAGINDTAGVKDGINWTGLIVEQDEELQTRSTLTTHTHTFWDYYLFMDFQAQL